MADGAGSGKKTFALRLGTVVIAAMLAAVLAVMVWQAHADRSLTLTSFEIAPDLASEGLTERAVGSELLDKLRRIQSEVATSQLGAQVRANDGQEIRLAVPQTGISLGEVQRLLSDLFGQQTPLVGGLGRMHGGPQDGALALSIRVGDGPGRKLVQPDGDLDALLQQAAEQVAESAEPQRFVLWLDQHGRPPEAIALSRKLADQGSPRTRSTALAFLASYDPSLSESRRLLRAAIELDPRNGNVINTLALNLPASEEKLELLRRAAERPVGDTAGARRLSVIVATANLNSQLGEYLDALTAQCVRYALKTCTSRNLTERALVTQADTTATDANAGIRRPVQVARISLTHDPESAGRLLTAPRPPEANQSEGGRALVELYWLSAQYAYAVQRQD